MSARKQSRKRTVPAAAPATERTRRASRPATAPVSGVKSLSWGERLDIFDALSVVLEGVYAHLTLKRGGGFSNRPVKIVGT